MKLLSYSFLWFALAVGSVVLGQETKPPQQKPAEDSALVFAFPGGSLGDFVESVKKQFSFDLREHATIDANVWSIKVPKMKVRYQSAQAATNEWQRVLLTYNALSQQTGEKLGRWIIQISGGSTLYIASHANQIAAIVFVAPPAAVAGQVAVRAFQLSELDEEGRKQLQEAISLERDRLRQYIEKGILNGNVADVTGVVQTHQQTQIMVAIGGPTYIELVQTLVSAFKERAALKQAEKDRLRPFPRP